MKQVYNFIDLDVDKIPYRPYTQEWYDVVKPWNKHTSAYKNENRIFSWFHNLHGDDRLLFTINGSYLHEAFDVPACNFCILAKLLEQSDVDISELKKFQHITRYEYIYKNIIEYAGVEFTDRNKKEIKRSCQHWLNIRKCRKRQGGKTDKFFNFVDYYFRDNFPTIYAALLNWREEKYTNKQGKNKKIKMLWWDFQKVEFDIISNKMCNYLFKKYQVTPITVHDALYLTDNDEKKVTEEIEDIFWNLIDYKFI